MDSALLPLELRSIEKLREQELGEARIIQNVMLPAHPLHAGSVSISHEFQPAAEVGGDYLDYFRLSDATTGCISATFPARGFPPRFTRRWAWARYAAYTRPARIPCASFAP